MDAHLEQMTQAIVAAAHPQQVLLFGSRATGHAQPSSDYDLALVFNSSDELRSGLRRAHRALWPRHHPVDLVALTAETFRQRNSVLAREVAANGQVLFQDDAPSPSKRS
jgi:predicted nucleotidyltransferase